MSVLSDGNWYSRIKKNKKPLIPSGLMFSFPCTVDSETKQWNIVTDLVLDEFARLQIDVTVKELEEEKEEISGLMFGGS